jgi:hypothetical protein
MLAKGRWRAHLAFGVAALVLVSGCGGGSAGNGLVATANTSKPIGPYVFDATNPTKKDTHWHAALGMYYCDHWLGDGSETGLWNWPHATPSGGPARASNTKVYAGLHIHGDGLVHMEPVSADEAGWNATLGRYFEFGGWRLSATGFTFLGTTTAGKCGPTEAKLVWRVAHWDGTAQSPHYKLGTGDPAAYKLYDKDVVVIAFLPRGRTVDTIGDPPSFRFLVSTWTGHPPDSTPVTIPNTTP